MMEWFFKKLVSFHGHNVNVVPFYCLFHSLIMLRDFQIFVQILIEKKKIIYVV